VQLQDEDVVGQEAAPDKSPTNSDESGTVEEAEGSPPLENLKLPSLTTLKEIVRLSEQVGELEQLLEQGLAAAKERGRDPDVRALEAEGDEPGMEG
jgi:hypothetical protein